MILAQPRRIELVVARRTAEVPDVRLAVSGNEGIARELVARPLANHRARGVADVVLVEGEQRAKAGMRERGAHAREAIVVQAAEIDALFEVDLRAARRLQGTIPTVLRIDFVGTCVLLAVRHPASSPNRFYLELFRCWCPPKRWFASPPPVSRSSVSVPTMRASSPRRWSPRTYAASTATAWCACRTMRRAFATAP